MNDPSKLLESVLKHDKEEQEVDMTDLWLLMLPQGCESHSALCQCQGCKEAKELLFYGYLHLQQVKSIPDKAASKAA